MRLIDADRLTREEVLHLWYHLPNGDMACPKVDIDNAPTISAIVIPENATSGDMIKAMFPLVEVKEKNNGYEVYFGIGTATQYFNYQWWNAPYKRGE